MDLHDELETAIGHGPALPAPTARLVAGRAALRRRRTLVAAGAAAAVAAVVVPVAALAGGTPTGGRDLTPAPAVSVSPTATPSAVPDPEPRFDRTVGDAAYVDFSTAELMIDPRAEVLRRVDDLYPGKDTESVALDLRLRDERQWIALEWDEGGSSGTYGGPDDPFYADWEDFLAKATSGGGMTDGRGVDPGARGTLPEPGTVVGLTMTPEGFEASGATSILEQRLDPALPEAFATDGMRTAAAYVDMDGVRQLVLFRDEIGGSTGEIMAVLSAGHGDSLDELLDWARERYASGEGLL